MFGDRKIQVLYRTKKYGKWKKALLATPSTLDTKDDYDFVKSTLSVKNDFPKYLEFQIIK